MRPLSLAIAVLVTLAGSAVFSRTRPRQVVVRTRTHVVEVPTPDSELDLWPLIRASESALKVCEAKP